MFYSTVVSPDKSLKFFLLNCYEVIGQSFAFFVFVFLFVYKNYEPRGVKAFMQLQERA